MGRYQWELFVLCGMGWLADKCVTQDPQLTLITNSLASWQPLDARTRAHTAAAVCRVRHNSIKRAIHDHDYLRWFESRQYVLGYCL